MKIPARAWRRFALCAPLVLLAACASGDKPKPLPVQAVVQAPGKAYVTIADANNGASVQLEPAQELRVDLSLSSYEVANNMDWSIVGLPPGVLTALDSRFERAGRDSNPLESDGTTKFRLKAPAAGRVTLSFDLRRPYSVGASTRSVSFDVTVK